MHNYYRKRYYFSELYKISSEQNIFVFQYFLNETLPKFKSTFKCFEIKRYSKYLTWRTLECVRLFVNITLSFNKLFFCTIKQDSNFNEINKINTLNDLLRYISSNITEYKDVIFIYLKWRNYLIGKLLLQSILSNNNEFFTYEMIYCLHSRNYTLI
jgi:hypothetical protein